MAFSTNKKTEPGHYARKGSKVGRLLWSISAMGWALIFCGLGVLRANSSLLWALVLILLGIGAGYVSLYGVITWWNERKER
ncbi:MAG: hypothetical protein WCS37_19450 [Chloroflexota bacterium]|nr:hypothetical protein [Chloroflexota bacterium]